MIGFDGCAVQHVLGDDKIVVSFFANFFGECIKKHSSARLNLIQIDDNRSKLRAI